MQRKLPGRAPHILEALYTVANKNETFYRAAIIHKMRAAYLTALWQTERSRGLKATSLPHDLWKALNKRYPGKA